MLIQRQLRNKDFWMMLKGSLLLINAVQQERKQRPSGMLGTLFDPNNPPKGTA